MGLAQADRDKWNKRYLNSNKGMPSPPVSLIAHQQYLITGSLLDVASGEGAVSLYVAALADMKVTAVDVSQVALDTLANLAGKSGITIDTQCLDLDDISQVANLGQFDNISIFRYKPSVLLFQQLVDLLSTNGRIILSTFNLKHSQTASFPERLSLTEQEFINVDPRLSLISYHQSASQPYTDTYIFQKI
jgi:2-polyprenyl-3-methyl-5-hydroxy-6-metoxy-1,4-benzoquinol methylase